MRILIVDDEAPARRRLRELLSDVAAQCPHEVVGEAVNGIEALTLVESTAPDLLLTDMQMPRMGGIELARHLLKLATPPAVVFATAHDEFALAAFEVHAIDYLMKPVRAERLLEALRKAGKRLPPDDLALSSASQESRRHFSINERGRIALVPLEEVIYLRAELKYVTVHTATRDYLLEESLTRLEEEFAQRFVRIHRNALVAVDRIAGFEKSGVSDADGEAGAQWLVILRECSEKLAVSRRQWGTVKELARARA